MKLFKARWFLPLFILITTKNFILSIFAYFLGSLIDRSINRSKHKQKSRTSFSHSQGVSSFELNLLALCSIIIKSDGKITQRELDFVRQKFVALYGKDKANAIFRTFNQKPKHINISLEAVCENIAHNTSYHTKLQILHLIFGVSASDGHISQSELSKLVLVARYFGISQQDYNSVKAMFIQQFSSSENAYKILGVSKHDSFDIIKKKYRELAKKYHPDRVNTSDMAMKKTAEEKFKKIQNAYEKIKKEKGL